MTASSGDDASDGGAYRFTDHSVLRPWATRVWFARLFPLLPAWLAANVVTLASTGSLAAVVVGSVFAVRIGPTALALLQLAALQVYVAGDHLDGMQAKASGTASPLGDFLDHHCDLWAGCILCFGYWSLAGGPTWELFALTGLLVIGFAVTYVERAEWRRLHFTAWGTLEVIAILTLFYVTWCIPATRAWWQGSLAGALPRHLIASAAGAAVAIGAIAVIVRRMGRVPAPLAVFTIAFVALATWCARRDDLPAAWTWVVASLAGADYVARVMRGHAAGAPAARPDTITIVGIALLWAFVPPSVDATRPLAALTAWLAVRYVVTLWRVLAGWRQHWAWVNAPPRTVP